MQWLPLLVLFCCLYLSKLVLCPLSLAVLKHTSPLLLGGHTNSKLLRWANLADTAQVAYRLASCSYDQKLFSNVHWCNACNVRGDTE